MASRARSGRGKGSMGGREGVSRAEGVGGGGQDGGVAEGVAVDGIGEEAFAAPADVADGVSCHAATLARVYTPQQLRETGCTAILWGGCLGGSRRCWIAGAGGRARSRGRRGGLPRRRRRRRRRW